MPTLIKYGKYIRYIRYLRQSYILHLGDDSGWNHLVKTRLSVTWVPLNNNFTPTHTIIHMVLAYPIPRYSGDDSHGMRKNSPSSISHAKLNVENFKFPWVRINLHHSSPIWSPYRRRVSKVPSEVVTLTRYRGLQFSLYFGARREPSTWTWRWERVRAV